MATVELVACIIDLAVLGAKILKRIGEFNSRASSIPESFQAVTAQLSILVVTLERLQRRTLDENDSRVLRQLVNSTKQQVQYLNNELDSVLPKDNSSTFSKVVKAMKSLKKQEKFQAALNSIHQNMKTLALNQMSIQQQVNEELLESSKAIKDKLNAQD